MKGFLKTLLCCVLEARKASSHNLSAIFLSCSTHEQPPPLLQGCLWLCHPRDSSSLWWAPLPRACPALLSKSWFFQYAHSSFAQGFPTGSEVEPQPSEELQKAPEHIAAPGSCKGTGPYDQETNLTGSVWYQRNRVTVPGAEPHLCSVLGQEFVLGTCAALNGRTSSFLRCL